MGTLQSSDMVWAMDDSGSAFKVKHGSDAAEVMNMHEAGALVISD